MNATTKLSQCKCYKDFSGEKCEIKDETKIVFRKSIQVISVMIAVLFLMLVIVFAVSMDVLNLFGIGNANKKALIKHSRDFKNDFLKRLFNL
jgi:hypothetical protein